MGEWTLTDEDKKKATVASKGYPIKVGAPIMKSDTKKDGKITEVISGSDGELFVSITFTDGSYLKHLTDGQIVFYYNMLAPSMKVTIPNQGNTTLANNHQVGVN